MSNIQGSIVNTLNGKHLLASGCTGGNDCCTDGSKCNEMEGDCDSDSQCRDGLKCGTDNCMKNGKSGGDWESDDDCCYNPNGEPCTII